MRGNTANQEQELRNALDDLAKHTLNREKELLKVLSVIDGLLRTREGIDLIYKNIPQIIDASVLVGSTWENPGHLVPSLVDGTLSSGFPSVIYESLSDLRMLKIAEGEMNSEFVAPDGAKAFIQDAVIHSFPVIFGNDKKLLETRKLTKNSLNRIRLLFDFIFEKIPLSSLKDKLAREVKEYADQRPILSAPLEEMLLVVKNEFDLNENSESDRILKFYRDSLFKPTELTDQHPNLQEYAETLENLSSKKLKKEAELMSSTMLETGLVSEYHAILILHLAQKEPGYIPAALALSSHGIAEFERHREFVISLINNYLSTGNKNLCYGLSRFLNRTLLSRKAVANSLGKLLTTRLHPEVKRRLSEATGRPKDVTPEKWLGSGIINMLGMPLSVGQGRNPTCQSARGLSMWSRHSPGKLLNMLSSVVASNELSFRFESEIINTAGILNEKSFDYNLDPVSIVLVPHLDYIYQQMMQKAQFKYPSKDPHVTVNPAFYGLWIQTGFMSCYNPVLNLIQNYKHFVKLFYAAYHPQYNGGFKLAYPVPLGIFITNAQADFMGFHAVSLLRVEKTEDGEWRAYFYNPNNEGRQNWGQEIFPSVSGNGENYGESSLPFYQFASRVYAFHFNSNEAEAHVKNVKDSQVEKVEILAREGWGRNYFWD